MGGFLLFVFGIMFNLANLIVVLGLMIKVGVL